MGHFCEYMHVRFWSALRLAPVRLWLIIFVIGATQFVFGYPGIGHPDTNVQYEQAKAGHYGNWHPPIMAYVWHWMLYFDDSSGPMLFIQLATRWAGYGLISHTLMRRCGWKAGMVPLAIGLYPPFAFESLLVLKDPAMTNAFLLAFGIIFFHRQLGKRFGPLSIAIAGIALLYGCLVRHNGAFGALGLIIYALFPAGLRRLRHFTAGAAVLLFLILPYVSTINRILTDYEQKLEYYVYAFDLMGIAYFSGHPELLGTRDMTMDDIHRCYMPERWDTLYFDGLEKCPLIPIDESKQTFSHWWRAVINHPLAYLHHRILHMNSEWFLFVPRHHDTWHMIFYPPEELVTEWFSMQSPLTYFMDSFKWIPVSRPFFCLVLGLILIWVHRPNQARAPGPMDDAVMALLWSGIIYMLSFAVLGIATHLRYHVWAMESVWLAIVLSMLQGSFWPSAHGQRRYGALLVALFILMLSSNLWMADPVLSYQPEK